MPHHPSAPGLLAGLLALAAAAPSAGLASTPQAWAAAERQADQECRFWLQQRGYTALQRLALDASGATYQPTDSGLKLRYQVRQGAQASSRAVSCSTRRPLFSPELP